MPASSRSCTCPRRASCRRRSRFVSFQASAPEKLTGGAQWYDYQMVEADRLTFAFAAAADRAGAHLANYVEATVAPPRRLADRRHAGPRHAHGPGPLDPRRRDCQRRRTARRRDHDRVRREAGVSAPQGDEPADVEAGERHGARRPGVARPHADARPLARAGARRHEPVADLRPAGRHRCLARRSRDARRRCQHGVPGPEDLDRRRHPRAPRPRASRQGTRRCPGASDDSPGAAITRKKAPKGRSRSSARSTRARAASQNK